jgi:hypothetical protein
MAVRQNKRQVALKNNFVKSTYCASFFCNLYNHQVRNIVVWLCFLTNTAFGMVQDAAPSTNAAAVLFVNRQPVSAEEFVWFMQQERAGVFQFVKTKFNLDYGTSFWDHKLPGGTPRALLRQRTVERIVREKVQLLLFRELGLVGEIGYENFVKNLEQLNDARESAARQGRVIYGPVRYTQSQYYEYWMSNLRLRAVEQLAQTCWDVSDRRVKKIYGRNKDKFRVGETSTLEMVTLQASNSETTGETLQTVARKIVCAVKTGSDLKTTAEGNNGDIKAAWQRFDEMNESRVSELFTDGEQAKKVLLLSPRQSVVLPVSKSEIKIVRCVSKTPRHYPSFEEIKSRVKSIYLDQLYDQMIDELAKKADVQITPKAMESFVQ